MQLTRDILKRSFWALPLGEVLDSLETTKAGLTEEEAEERRALFKKNILPPRTRLTKLTIFLRQFRSPLITLLLAATSITIFLRDYKDAVVILAAVAANVGLGFYQESKAESALTHLKTYIKERVRVFRNGQELEIDASNLVPGDIIHLSQGDRVPADGRLVYINDFFVDESILTGESLSVLKTTEPSSFKAVLGDRRSMIFSGTLVVQGFANAVITATGPETELGKIARLVAGAEKETTPLQRAIFNFSLKTGLILVALTIAIFFLGIYLGVPLLEMFLISVAITVAAVPEGLPVALTVILAIGVQRLASRNGIVRKLLAAETLGNTSVILTDKTGTLTEAKMNLARLSIFDKSVKESQLLKYALLNTDVVVENHREAPEKWRIIGRPLEIAMVRSAAEKNVLLHEVKHEIELLDYLPFTSKNKFSASLVKIGDRHILNVLGAPEILLKLANVSESEHNKLLREIEKMAYAGERVLGLASRVVSSPDNISLRQKSAFDGLNFLGTLSFRDPIRPGVKDAIEKVSQAGVRTVILTGDHRGTAEAVAKELGMHVDRDQVIDGPELDSLSDDDLKVKLPILKIISRVSPEGKLRVAKALQSLGEVVAMTGDGLNDAASLKQADIGVAMGSGTDVAKDVSDLILLDDNFATIVAAVEEGRRIIENIRKVIVYLSASLFDELILIGGSLIFGLVLPLNALQILFVNFVADSFPALSLAFENHVDHLLSRRKISKNLFDREMSFLTFAVGLPTSVLLFVLYWGLLKYGFDPLVVQTFIFTAFGSYSMLLIFAVRSLRLPIWSYNPFSNPVLVAGVIFGLLTVLASVYWLPLQNLIGTVSLPWPWLLGVLGVGLVNLSSIELGKFALRKLRLNGE